MKSILRPSTDPSLIFQNADLNADQRAVLSLIDGTRSLEQICALSGLGDFNTLKALFLLLAIRVAEEGELGSEEEKRFAHDAVCAASKLSGNPADEGSAPEPAATRRMIEDAFQAMPALNFYQVLGIQKTASAVELRKSYFRHAKMYHPDRHFEPEMIDMKEKLEALFSRIHDAYRTLSDPGRRSQYDLDSGGKPAPAEYEEKRAEEYVENYAEKTARAVAYFNAGMKEFSIGNFWGAAEDFAWATRLDPVKAPYFYHYGRSLMYIPRRRHEAEENLKKAIEIDPINPEYHLELGNLYIKSGVRTKALDIFLIGLRNVPGSDKIQEAIRAAGGEIPKQNDSESDGIFKKIFKDSK
jgi:curved DNA-binding protein CbpA